jgi:hypothetical protein
VCACVCVCGGGVCSSSWRWRGSSFDAHEMICIECFRHLRECENFPERREESSHFLKDEKKN